MSLHPRDKVSAWEPHPLLTSEEGITHSDTLSTHIPLSITFSVYHYFLLWFFSQTLKDFSLSLKQTNKTSLDLITVLKFIEVQFASYNSIYKSTTHWKLTNRSHHTYNQETRQPVLPKCPFSYHCIIFLLLANLFNNGLSSFLPSLQLFQNKHPLLPWILPTPMQMRLLILPLCSQCTACDPLFMCQATPPDSHPPCQKDDF